MARLSSSIAEIKEHYTVVVVGSGYGGGIAASRLARAGQQVCLLERGKEFQPGEFPNTLRSALPEMQADTPVNHIGSPLGLYDFRLNPDINVFLGCGLGGTSLVNAGVSLRPEPRVFEDSSWPQEIREDLNDGLEQGYQRAEAMLRPAPYPQEFPPLPKLMAHQRSAEFLKERFYRTPINVTFSSGANPVGVWQSACNNCGDCVSGCNFTSKNTTVMNYLPDAVNHGAEIFTQVLVSYVERRDNRWVVHYRLQGGDPPEGNEPLKIVTADVVVLSAGSLGSTEILLRSRETGLSLSDQLGLHFSGNGDTLGFAYNTDHTIDGVGIGNKDPDKMPPIGPCITGIIDGREKADLSDSYIIEEGVVPGGFSSFLAPAFAAGARLLGRDTDTGTLDWIKERLQIWYSLLRGPYHGAVNRTQTYLVNTHDDSSGRLHLEDDRLRIDWPGVGAQSVFDRVSVKMREATRALGGTYIINPTWSSLTNHNVTTVHPLGGCRMSDDASGGAVNHKGQVYSGSQGQEVHEGLYVVDGAVIPRSLGVNPLLTISAVSERSIALLLQDQGWV